MAMTHSVVSNNITDIMFHELSTNPDMWVSFIETVKHPAYYTDFNDILVSLVKANVDEYLVTNYYKYMVYTPNHRLFPFPVHNDTIPNVIHLLTAIDASTLSYNEIIEDLFTLTGQQRFNKYLITRLIERSTTVVGVDNYMDTYTDSSEWIAKLLTYGRITPPALSLFIKKSISNLPDDFFHKALHRIYNSTSITSELREQYDEVIMNGYRRKILLGFNNVVSHND